jgi:hypothetical protein
MLTEDDILYEVGDYWVCAELHGTGRFKPKTIGFAIYKNGVTHATKVATIGYSGKEGLSIATTRANTLAQQAIA